MRKPKKHVPTEHKLKIAFIIYYNTRHLVTLSFMSCQMSWLRQQQI